MKFSHMQLVNLLSDISFVWAKTFYQVLIPSYWRNLSVVTVQFMQQGLKFTECFTHMGLVKAADNRTPCHKFQRLQAYEKSHATHQVGVWCCAMIIPFRTP